MIGIFHHDETILILFAKVKVNDIIFGNNFSCNYCKKIKRYIIQDHLKGKQYLDN